MKYHKLFIVLLFLLCFQSVVFASDSTAAFLRNGGGAKAMALGESLGAQSADVWAPFYNPAGIIGINGIAIESMYQSLLLDANYKSIGFAVKIPIGVLGANYYVAGVNSISETVLDVFGRPYLTGNSFSYLTSALLLSFATDINLKNFVIGSTFKIVEERLWTNKSSGYGMDVGLIYRFDDNYNLGLSVVNLMQPKLKWDTYTAATDVIPMLLVGAFHYCAPDGKLMLNASIQRPSLKAQTYHFGVSYRIAQLCEVRAGINDGQGTYGLGIIFDRYSFDYAILLSKYDELGNLQRFSFGINIPIPEKIKILANTTNVIIDNPVTESADITQNLVEISTVSISVVTASVSVTQTSLELIPSEVIFITADPVEVPPSPATRNLLSTSISENLPVDSSPSAEITVSYEKIPPLNHQLSNALCEKAYSDSFNEKFESAVVNYEKAIQTDPGYAKSYIGLGDTYIKMGKKRKAVTTWKHALELEPENKQLLLKIKLYQ